VPIPKIAELLKDDVKEKKSPSGGIENKALVRSHGVRTWWSADMKSRADCYIR